MATALTDLERRVLAKMYCEADGNDLAFGCIENLKVSGLNRQQLGGVITSLVTKQVITVHQPVVTNNGGRGNVWTQFTFNDCDAVKLLLAQE